MKRLHRPSPAMVLAVVALVVALAGTAYAASKIDGSSIRKNSVPANRIEKNSLAGKQINESKLGKVPTTSQADTVNGLSLVKIDYRSDAGSDPETILDLAGLKIVASCGPSDFPGAIATTTKEDSSLYGVSEYPPNLDRDSFDYEGGDFDANVAVDLDEELDNLGDPRIGSLVYEAPDGSGVTVDFASDANGTSDCLITGTAIGG